MYNVIGAHRRKTWELRKLRVFREGFPEEVMSWGKGDNRYILRNWKEFCGLKQSIKRRGE